MRLHLQMALPVCAVLLGFGQVAFADSTNGSAGLMPAFYDGQRFQINFKELPSAAEQAVLNHNISINTIYMSDPGLPGGQPFISVLDAIQRDGFNPLWREVQIVFNVGHTPRQITSDNDVLAAATTGEITLTATTEIYRCSVVGSKSGNHPANLNGSGGDMPAFYDGEQFTINFKELPTSAEQAVISNNGSINTIYMSDPGLPGGQPFISVLDAIQGDGFNPLWREVQITFNTGHTPHQFASDNEILSAALSGEITLTTTDEVYRCSVVGIK